MKIYTGERTFDAVVVKADGEFEWGFEGAAAEQLAVALITDAADAETARQWSAPFMKSIVANFANEWEMTDEQIVAALNALR